MERLFTLDEKDYTDDMPVYEKTVVRALIVWNGLYAMQQSGEGYYKIPGGGIEPGERDVDTLVREVREETGLVLDTSRIEPLGAVEEKRRDICDAGRIYLCHTRFYECSVLPQTVATEMTESEIALGFHPVWVSLDEILQKNAELEAANLYWKVRDYRFLLWYREHCGASAIALC